MRLLAKLLGMHVVLVFGRCWALLDCQGNSDPRRQFAVLRYSLAPAIQRSTAGMWLCLDPEDMPPARHSELAQMIV